jgi:ribonuclease VapC
MSLVIDSSAVIAILKAEEDAAELLRTLLSAERPLMGAATYLECGTVVLRRMGRDRLADYRNFLDETQVEVVSMTREEADAGIEAYARYGRGSKHPAGLNLGDCFSYALARTRNLPLLFKGEDFVHTDIEPAVAAG